MHRKASSAEVIDLATISPIDAARFSRSVAKTGRLVIAHEAARNCGVGARRSQPSSRSAACTTSGADSTRHRSIRSCRSTGSENEYIPQHRPHRGCGEDRRQRRAVMTTFKLLPILGEGLPEAEKRRVARQEGDRVDADQPMVSVETAKAVVEVPSPYTGVITEAACEGRRDGANRRTPRRVLEGAPAAAAKPAHMMNRRQPSARPLHRRSRHGRRPHGLER